MKIGVIIPAAGKGTRMKTDKYKQFMDLKGKPILVHTLKLFDKIDDLDDIITVVPEEKVDYCKNEIINKYNLPNIKVISGGRTRKESVYFGLKTFSQEIDYVIIHDGVRPLLPIKVIHKVINSLKKFQALAVGVEVKDTIKIKDENDFVEKTLDRSQLVGIQTPQAFKYDLILKAHESVLAEKKYYDDASLVEESGHAVKIIEGSYKNIKITTPGDLLKAEFILDKEQLSNESRAWI